MISLLVLSPSFLQHGYCLNLVAIRCSKFIFFDNRFNDSLNIVQSRQEKFNIQLLLYFLFTVNSLLHLLPSFAPATERANFEKKISKIWKEIEARKVNFLVVFILEEVLSDFEFKRHKCEISHEKHKAKDGSNKSTDIRKELVYFIEGPFVQSMIAWLNKPN